MRLAYGYKYCWVFILREKIIIIPFLIDIYRTIHAMYK